MASLAFVAERVARWLIIGWMAARGSQWVWRSASADIARSEGRGAGRESGRRRRSVEMESGVMCDTGSDGQRIC